MESNGDETEKQRPEHHPDSAGVFFSGSGRTAAGADVYAVQRCGPAKDIFDPAGGSGNGELGLRFTVRDPAFGHPRAADRVVHVPHAGPSERTVPHPASAAYADPVDLTWDGAGDPVRVQRQADQPVPLSGGRTVRVLGDRSRKRDVLVPSSLSDDFGCPEIRGFHPV